MSTSYSPALTPAESRAFEAVRARFPGALTQSYIDTASRGLMLGDLPQIAFDYLNDRVYGRANKEVYFETVEAVRQGMAQMLNARTEEIAFSKNVSDGVNMVATAMDWRAGDEVFLCAGIEHPANIYVWRNLANLGVTVRDFAPLEGEFPTDAVIEALQGAHRARVVTVAGTSFVPGFRAQLERLGAACRAAGARLVVDGAQSTGITHFDLAQSSIDALAMSGQKGLCSVYGMGFLYVREDFAKTLRPRYLSRFGVEISSAHEADYDSGPVTYQRGALRFDLGNYNFLAARLVTESLKVLNALGTAAIDRHTSALAARLAKTLAGEGAPVRIPAAGHGANIVCVESQHGVEPVVALQKYLKERNVQAALRRNVVRFSFHCYNNLDDVEAAEAACRSWLRENGNSLGNLPQRH